MDEWFDFVWGDRRLRVHAQRHRELVEQMKASGRLVHVDGEWKLRLPRHQILAVLRVGLAPQEHDSARYARPRARGRQSSGKPVQSRRWRAPAREGAPAPKEDL